MKTRQELQIERNRLRQLFESLQAAKKDFDTAYTLGALHVLEWVLNHGQQPISQYILFKFKQENK